MMRFLQLAGVALALVWAAPAALAQSSAPAPTVQTSTSSNQPSAADKAHAAAPVTKVAVSTAPTPPGPVATEATDLLERFVGWLHHFFPQIDDAVFHWIAFLIVVLLAVLLRRVIRDVIFHYLKKLAERTETTLDDKLFPALEGPAATLVLVVGIFGALTVLQLSPTADVVLYTTGKIAVLAVIIWGLIRAFGAILDHFEEIAHHRQMTVATFMPLIKKTLLVFAIILGILFIAESIGAKVGVFLTSLGIGGLAFALAAQDTIANLFGSFVVVVDQPFKVGDWVKMGTVVGQVEDIGLRSTKLRMLDKSLMVIPNKSVASEQIINFSRFTRRRVEQVFGLTYDTTPDQMEAIIQDLRKLLTTHPQIDAKSVSVYFRDLNTSSLDLWVVYETPDANFDKSMVLREAINLAIMRAVAARGLSFAFPTQTIQLDGAIARQLATRSSAPPA